MKPKYLPVIGLLSGIGPLAGADVYRKMLAYASSTYDAAEDSDYPTILLFNRGIPGVGDTADPSDIFKDELCRGIARLQAGGATVIGIACNTAHMYYETFPVKRGSVTLHLLDEVAKRAADDKGKILILSSHTTRTHGLYKHFLDVHNVTAAPVPNRLQHILDEVIGRVMAHDVATAGHILDDVLTYALVKGYKTIIAGCTELPLALAASKLASHFEIIDSNQVLAESLVDLYYIAYESHCSSGK